MHRDFRGPGWLVRKGMGLFWHLNVSDHERSIPRKGQEKLALLKSHSQHVVLVLSPQGEKKAEEGGGLVTLKGHVRKVGTIGAFTKVFRCVLTPNPNKVV
ncbi:hypothetical protein SDJN03_18695, partial [Cucurbita argyrosperma subsp. sororia]